MASCMALLPKNTFEWKRELCLLMKYNLPERQVDSQVFLRAFAINMWYELVELAKGVLLTAYMLGIYLCFSPTPLYEITLRIGFIVPTKLAGEGQGQTCKEQPTTLYLCSAYSEQGGGGISLDFVTAEAAWRFPGISVQFHDHIFRLGGKNKDVFLGSGELLPMPFQGCLYAAKPQGMMERERQAEGPRQTLLTGIWVAPTWGSKVGATHIMRQWGF